MEDYYIRTAAISPSLLRTVRSVRIYQDYQEVKAPSYINNQQGGAPSSMRDLPPTIDISAINTE